MISADESEPQDDFRLDKKNMLMAFVNAGDTAGARKSDFKDNVDTMNYHIIGMAEAKGAIIDCLWENEKVQRLFQV